MEKFSIEGEEEETFFIRQDSSFYNIPEIGRFFSSTDFKKFPGKLHKITEIEK